MKRYVHDKNLVDMINDLDLDTDNIESSKFNNQQEEIESSFDTYDETEGWELVRHKEVYDFDGFLTDYTLWYNSETDEWCTVFGDRDIYHPWDSDHDMDFEDEDEAQDWFDDYSSDDEDY